MTLTSMSFHWQLYDSITETLSTDSERLLVFSCKFHRNDVYSCSEQSDKDPLLHRSSTQIRGLRLFLVYECSDGNECQADLSLLVYCGLGRISVHRYRWRQTVSSVCGRGTYIPPDFRRH